MNTTKKIEKIGQIMATILICAYRCAVVGFVISILFVLAQLADVGLKSINLWLSAIGLGMTILGVVIIFVVMLLSHIICSKHKC